MITDITEQRRDAVFLERMGIAGKIAARRAAAMTERAIVVMAAEAKARARFRRGDSVDTAAKAGEAYAREILKTERPAVQRGPVATNGNVVRMPRRRRQIVGVTQDEGPGPKGAA